MHLLVSRRPRDNVDCRLHPVWGTKGVVKGGGGGSVTKLNIRWFRLHYCHELSPVNNDTVVLTLCESMMKHPDE